MQVLAIGHSVGLKSQGMQFMYTICVLFYQKNQISFKNCLFQVSNTTNVPIRCLVVCHPAGETVDVEVQQTKIQLVHQKKGLVPQLVKTVRLKIKRVVLDAENATMTLGAETKEIVEKTKKLLVVAGVAVMDVLSHVSIY